MIGSRGVDLVFTCVRRLFWMSPLRRKASQNQDALRRGFEWSASGVAAGVRVQIRSWPRQNALPAHLGGRVEVEVREGQGPTVYRQQPEATVVLPARRLKLRKVRCEGSRSSPESFHPIQIARARWHTQRRIQISQGQDSTPAARRDLATASTASGRATAKRFGARLAAGVTSAAA